MEGVQAVRRHGRESVGFLGDIMSFLFKFLEWLPTA